MKIVSIVIGLLIAFFGTAHATAQDLAAGEALYKKSCRTCHGPTGKGLSSYPKLTGQTAEYLVDKLKKYRSGDRLGPNTPLMAPNAAKLSDDDINNVAGYIVATFK